MNPFKRLLRFFFRPQVPTRLLAERRLRPAPAMFAGGLAGLIFLAGYYLTLGLLPMAFAYPVTLEPFAPWARRFDLAQFVGSLLRPPYPTLTTWWIGVIVLAFTFAALGAVYALLLSWSLQRSDVGKGVGFGVGLFVGLGAIVWVANGFHPAIQRNALPDTGFFMLGWSILATLQVLILALLYGATLGSLYRRWTLR